MGQFGQELRQEREGRGVSVDQICAVTKVSSRHVEALEADRYEELPGGVFRKGIVRSYISVVGLEESIWIERFEASLRERGLAEAAEPDWAEFAENIKKNRSNTGRATGLRWLGVVLMLLLLFVGGWLTWKYVLNGKMISSATPTSQRGAMWPHRHA
jgi:cytoskeleton protein RodZ